MFRRDFFKNLFATATVWSFVPFSARAVSNESTTEKYVHVYGKVVFTDESTHNKNKEALARMVDTECDAMKRDFMRAMSSQEHLKNNVLPYTRSYPDPFLDAK